MSIPVFEREISERLKIFLGCNHALSHYKVFIDDNSNLNLEGILDFMINTLFAKNNWNDIDDWTIVFYILTGRFALKNDLISLRWGFQSNGIHGVASEIEKYLKEWDPKSRITFTSVESDSIFIDISHTLNYPFNTGIQTVVRNIGKSLLEDSKVHWVIWNEIYQVWQLVDREIVSKSLPFQNKSKVTPSKISRIFAVIRIFVKAFWYGIYSSYRYLLSNQSEEFKLPTNLLLLVKKYLQYFRTLKVSFKNQGEIRSPLLYNQTLLIIEPIQGANVTKRLYYLPKIARLSVLVYDLIPISHPEFFTTFSTQNFLNYLKVLNLANNLIAISDFTSSQISQFVSQSESKNITAISLPISLDYSIEDSSENLSTPIFLCVGSIEPRKNHMNLLKAAEACWSTGLNFELVLVGGQGWANSDVIKYILDLKSKNYKIRVIRDASNLQIMKLYSEAYAFITIPWVEGFGLPLAEAISTGKFVIASRIDSHLEFGQVEGVYFVKPDEIDMISDSMKRILNYRATNRHKLIPRRTQLSWDEYSARLIQSAIK
jgi:glycosyltransferase involved in cell wall biosynthesis